MSSAKFSDFPHYMLNDYFKIVKSYYNLDKLNEIKDTVINTDSYLSFDNPYLDFSSKDDFLSFGEDIELKKTKISNVRLRGPKNYITANGSEYTSFYAKIENYGYKEVKLKPAFNKEFDEENWFNFDRSIVDEKTTGIYSLEEAKEFLYGEARYETEKKPVEKEENYYLVIDDLYSNDKELIDYKNANIGKISEELIKIDESKEDKSFAFKVYRKKEESEDISLQPEHEIYLRQDSLFFDWYRKNLKKYGTENIVLDDKNKEISTFKYFKWNHKDFINENLLFSYVGTIHPTWNTTSEWRIYHKTLKDFMINSVPVNDITPQFKTFVWELYDRVNQEIYCKQKNLYTLLDYEEIDEEFLGYLSLFYNFDLDIFYNVPDMQKRWFIENLPILLKKKGTWVSMKLIWENLLRKRNKLSFYERWHNREIKNIESAFDFRQVEVKE